jgi:hypothetical protein
MRPVCIATKSSAVSKRYDDGFLRMRLRLPSSSLKAMYDVARPHPLHGQAQVPGGLEIPYRRLVPVHCFRPSAETLLRQGTRVDMVSRIWTVACPACLHFRADNTNGLSLVISPPLPRPSLLGALAVNCHSLLFHSQSFLVLSPAG